jgi:aminoglycoside phosphotransferase (APT) family kinase protein
VHRVAHLASMLDVDPMRVLSALGVAQPQTVTPIAGGWDTLLWRVEGTDRQVYALRVFRRDQAATCRREVLVMRTLADTQLPVPSVITNGMSDERPALLMSWCAGIPLLNSLLAQPWSVWRLGTAMGRTHARLHQITPTSELVGDLPRTAIEGRSTAILHMDFHPLNLMTDGGGITGVLDWANVALGDPRADLARTVTLLRLAPSPPGGARLLTQLLRGLLEFAWRAGYRREQGDASDPFEAIDPFYVWAGEWMERDLRQKLGKPGVWLQASDLARINAWTQSRRRQPVPPP